MTFLAPHKFWLATLVFAVALMFSSAPLLGFLRDGATQHLQKMQAEDAKLQKALQRLDDDIAMTRKLNGQIGAAEVEKSLAFVDRLHAADVLQKQADAARFSHFVYTVSPEERKDIANPGTGKEELAVSTVGIKGDVPLDTDAYGFVQRIRTAMPGRLRLQSLKLERMGAEGAPPAADNLHVTADFEWLSNGVARQVAEGR